MADQDQTVPVPAAPAPAAKPAWQSKTLWVNLLLAIAAFFPGVQQFAAAHPESVMFVIAGVNLVLRAVTKGGVQLS